jgi:hypothetical protein
MKIETKEVYTCEHCKKYLVRKSAMVNHEFNCTYNPKNHVACIGCKFIKQEPTEYAYTDYDGDRLYKTGKKFVCAKLNKTMYPFVLVKRGILKLNPEQFLGQEQMPPKCDSFTFE